MERVAAHGRGKPLCGWEVAVVPGCRVLALATAAVLALGGCGTRAGDRSAAASGTPDAKELGSLYRRLAQCFRTHGAPGFPDPVRDPATGRWEPAKGASPPPPGAVKACKQVGDEIAKAERAVTPTTADLSALRRFGDCMRAHGLPDWPSPGPDGTFTLPSRLGRLGDKGVAKQIGACKGDLPPRGFRVAPRR